MTDELSGRLLAQLQKRGDAPLVILNDNQISYSDAYKKIASYILAINETVPSNQLIGIMTARCAQGYLATLAVILSGRAWVPLTPTTPIARLQKMMAQTELACVFVDAPSLGVFNKVCSENNSITGILVGDAPYDTSIDIKLFRPEAKKSIDIPSHSVSLSNLAYVLFTSGTTGSPKGVPITRGNIIAYLDAIQRRFNYTPEDKHSQTFEMSFDLSVHDLLVPATTGGSIVPFIGAELLSPYRKVVKTGLTCWFSVPSQVALLERARGLKPDSMQSLRLSLFCGEPLLADLTNSWQRAASNSAIYNLYGPTEATIAVTTAKFSENSLIRRGIVSLGLPWNEGSTVVVDPLTGKKIQGCGQGELWLSGRQLSDGYWRSPEDTKNKFIQREGILWYRTGDLVEVDDNGQLHFVSRLDGQIKLRGHRIETLEVEQVLRKITGAQTAVVVPLKSNKSGTEILVAVLYCSEKDIELIKNRVRKILPNYMVPERIVFFDGDPPRNASGKIDFKVVKQMLMKM